MEGRSCSRPDVGGAARLKNIEEIGSACATVYASHRSLSHPVNPPGIVIYTGDIPFAMAISSLTQTRMACWRRFRSLDNSKEQIVCDHQNIGTRTAIKYKHTCSSPFKQSISECLKYMQTSYAIQSADLAVWGRNRSWYRHISQVPTSQLVKIRNHKGFSHHERRDYEIDRVFDSKASQADRGESHRWL
jgi:hypothetical protein